MPITCPKCRHARQPKLFVLLAGVVWASLQAGRNKAGGASSFTAVSAGRSAAANMSALAGTPFLVINRGGKTYRMKSGFDSDEFLALLAR